MIIVIIAAIGGAYYLGTQKSGGIPVVQSPSPSPAASQEPSGSPETANWKTYTNSFHGYSFKYPSGWEIDLSKADPKTANNPGGAPNMSLIYLKKDGYIISFVYDIGGIGGGPTIAALTEEITIDGKKYLKDYVNTSEKEQPYCDPNPGVDENGKELKPKQECYTHFDQVRINGFPEPDGIAGIGATNINGKTVGITFRLPKLIKVDDKEFQQYDLIFNKFLTLIDLP